MKNKNHPLSVTVTRDQKEYMDKGLTKSIMLQKTKDGAELTIGRNFGEIHVGRVNIHDAMALISALKESFGIRDTEDELRLLLQSKEDNVEQYIESFTTTCIANVMYENGLKTAVLTPSRILSGEVPNVEIDNTIMGAIKYTLLGEPLNVPYPTDNTSADNQ